MNQLTQIRNLNKINEIELKQGSAGNSKSWHRDYSGSAWNYVGGMPFDLNEGDVISVFSQYGEVVNVNLIRDKNTGNSKGYCFLCYEDQRSTVLAVDNFNGIKLGGRTIKVDHVKDYRAPKDHENDDTPARFLKNEGCAPQLLDSLNELQTPSHAKSLIEEEHGNSRDNSLISSTRSDRNPSTNRLSRRCRTSSQRHHHGSSSIEMSEGGSGRKSARMDKVRRNRGDDQRCIHYHSSSSTTRDGRPGKKIDHIDETSTWGKSTKHNHQHYHSSLFETIEDRSGRKSARTYNIKRDEDQRRHHRSSSLEISENRSGRNPVHPSCESLSSSRGRRLDQSRHEDSTLRSNREDKYRSDRDVPCGHRKEKNQHEYR